MVGKPSKSRKFRMRDFAVLSISAIIRKEFIDKPFQNDNIWKEGVHPISLQQISSQSLKKWTNDKRFSKEQIKNNFNFWAYIPAKGRFLLSFFLWQTCKITDQVLSKTVFNNYRHIILVNIFFLFLGSLVFKIILSPDKPTYILTNLTSRNANKCVYKTSLLFRNIIGCIIGKPD